MKGKGGADQTALLKSRFPRGGVGQGKKGTKREFPLEGSTFRSRTEGNVTPNGKKKGIN